MGKNKNAGQDAAKAANKYTQLGINELKPFLDAGSEQLGSLKEGATVGGLDAVLASLMDTDMFSSLAGAREDSMKSQLSAGGLTRSGAGLEAMAQIPAELALQLESLLSGRKTSLANMGLSAGGGVANMYSEQGQNVSSGIITDAEAAASRFGNVANLASGILFSDERLKENIVEISKIGDLKVVEWDWIPQADNTIIAGCPTVGFLAQDVRDKHPEFVGEYSGWLFVDYDGLMHKLQSDLNDKIASEAA